MNCISNWQDSLDGGSAHRIASACTGQYNHRRNAYIHAPGAILIYETSVPVLEHSVCFQAVRPFSSATRLYLNNSIQNVFHSTNFLWI
jgi:hypothetical protein